MKGELGSSLHNKGRQAARLGQSLRAPRRGPASADSRRFSGFSLAELVVASAVFGLVMIGAVSIFAQSVASSGTEAGRQRINADVRKLTSDLSREAVYSSYFVLFPSFEERSRTTETQGGGRIELDNAVRDGGSGDMVVFVFRDLADERRISRIVGYYGHADEGHDAALHRFERRFTPSVTTSFLHEILPAPESAGAHPVVVERLEGLAEGRVFYNLFDRSVMVKAEIRHQGNLYRAATNTYNFTVSPRG